MARDFTHIGNIVARCMLFQTTVALVALGIELFMCVYGLTVFLETPRSARAGRAPYLAISFCLFVLLSTTSLLDLDYFFRLLLDASSPENFLYLREKTNGWVNFASQVITNTVCFIGDGLMLYRCYIVWYDRRWVVVVPAMAYVTSVVFGILMVIPVARDVADGNANLSFSSIFVALSVALNILVTLLISSRLIFARRKVSSMVSDSTGLSQYTGVIAILIESAVPLSVAGLGLAIVLGISHDNDPNLLEKEISNYIFSSFYFTFAALSPQMIIFRVTTGRSWVSDFNKATSRARGVSQDLVFARSYGGDSHDISAIERQGPTEASAAQSSEKV